MPCSTSLMHLSNAHKTREPAVPAFIHTGCLSTNHCDLSSSYCRGQVAVGHTVLGALRRPPLIQARMQQHADDAATTEPRAMPLLRRNTDSNKDESPLL